MNDKIRIHMEVAQSFRDLCEKTTEYSNAPNLTEMFRRAVRIYARLMWAIAGSCVQKGDRGLHQETDGRAR
jgi:hypothetical protein